MRAWLLAAVAAFVPLTIAASEWVQVSVSRGGVTVYVERESLLRDGNVVKAWTKQLFGKPETTKSGKRYQSIRMLMLYDCARQTAACQQASYFDSANLSGKAVETYTLIDQQLEWQDVAPDLSGKAALEFACRNAAEAAAR